MRRGRKKRGVKGLAGTGEQTQSRFLFYAWSFPFSCASACGTVGPGDQKPSTPAHLPMYQPQIELSQLGLAPNCRNRLHHYMATNHRIQHIEPRLDRESTR